MTRYWEHTEPTARLKDRREVLGLIETTLTEAQAAVNFVVFAPEWLPDDCRLGKVTLRPEQPPGRPGGVQAAEIGQTPWTEANPCSIRAMVAGKQRRLRIKQFLYDWAPPAASTAPLWNSPPLTPIPFDGAVAWLGTDYMKHRGGCVQLMRTQIELSVVEGNFTDDELGAILAHLKPAALDASKAVQRASFHLLSYWVRYQLRSVEVPHGLWKYRYPRHYERSRRLSLSKLHSHPPIRLLFPEHSPYVFDSAVVIEEDKPFHREVELIFRHQANKSDYLWMLAVDHASERVPEIPPEPETHSAEIRKPIGLRAGTVWYGALSERYGAWEALWEENEVRYIVWAGATPLENADAFKKLVDGLRMA